MTVQNEDSLPLLLKPSEVAEQLRLSRATVYRLINSGELKTVTVGQRQRKRVTRDSFQQYVARGTQPEPNPAA